MAIVIGITGGIGSGKTTVCNVFRILGAPVFEADAVARQLMDSDEIIKNSLIDLFGKTVYIEGKLNRNMLATAIFRNTGLRAKVNELVHPAVYNDFYEWLKRNKKFKYVIYEAAILFEGGFYEKMDFSILVTAPEEERIARVMKRSGISEQSVRERMKSQWTDIKKKGIC